jgi:hypothetical protein
LQSEVNQGRLPAPDGNTLYVVFLPPSVNSAWDIQKNWAGHHWFFQCSWTVGNQTVSAPLYYAVIEHPLSGHGFLGGRNGLETNLQDLTEIASHELVEAISDPMGNAWSSYEIGDIAQDHPPPGGTVGIEAGYAIQKYYSNADQTSIDPGGTDFLPLSKIAPDLTGVHVMLYSVQNQQVSAIPVSFVSSLPNQTAGVYLYQVSWGTDQQHALATVFLDPFTDGFSVSIRADDSSVLFGGDILAPQLTWQPLNYDARDWAVTSGSLEMSGTVFDHGTQLSAFGVQDNSQSSPSSPSGGGSGGGWMDGSGSPLGPHYHNLE